LVALARTGIDVTVAGWLEPYADSPFLCVGSKAVDEGRFGKAFEILYDCLQKQPGSAVELSDVKLLPTTVPLVNSLLTIRDMRDGGHSPVHSQGAHLNEFGIARAYIYERVTGALTRDEVIRKVAVMLDDRSPATPATISRRSGPELRGVPFGLEVTNTGTGRVLEVKIRSATDGATLSVPVDDVANIL
jgi:hypothetical protein